MDSGEESQDLGIQPQTEEGQLSPRRSVSYDRMDRLQTYPSRQQPQENAPVAANPDINEIRGYMQESNRDINHTSQQINIDRRQYERREELWRQHSQTHPGFAHSIQAPNQGVTERLTLDPYYPFFDQTMLDLFPYGEMPDLSQFDADLGDLDFFELEGWNAGSTNPSED